MMQYTVWELILPDDLSKTAIGMFNTGFFARANKFEHVEQMLNDKIADIGKPCVIVITKFEPDENVPKTIG